MGIQPIRKTVAPEIPDKLYFRIGDVARICEVPAYVLRFWETEFPQLKPNKGGTGQRLYRKRDVEMALRIKSLLYDKGYTIPGARQVFKDEIKARETVAAEASTPAPAAPEVVALAAVPAPVEAATPVLDPAAELRRRAQLRALRAEMQALLTLLDAPGPSFGSATGPATFGAPRAALAAAAKQPADKPMRPRLVLEPRPAASRADAPRPEMLRLVRDAANQGDLFPGE